MATTSVSFVFLTALRFCSEEFLQDINHEELATYAQLLHLQDEIAETLKSHLQTEGNAALSALIE